MMTAMAGRGSAEAMANMQRFNINNSLPNLQWLKTAEPDISRLQKVRR